MKKVRLLLIVLTGLVLINLFLFKAIEKEKDNRDQASQAVLKKEQTSGAAQLNFTVDEGGPKIVLAAVGDVGLNREINWQIQDKKDPTFPFQKIAENLSKADLTIGNLEGPLIKDCPIARKGTKFCGNPENAEGLSFAGFDLLNLANNHAKDYGQDGFSQTIEILKSQQIDYFGFEKMARQEINGIKLVFLGFDDVTSSIEKERLIQEVGAAKTGTDFVIINFHWGTEYQKNPNKRQKELAHLAIDNGADLIIGHHPHVLQPAEYYQEKLILYSLGNFVFDQMWSRETRIGAIALITLEKEQRVRVEFIPIMIYNYSQPALIPKPEKSVIISQFGI